MSFCLCSKCKQDGIISLIWKRDWDGALLRYAQDLPNREHICDYSMFELAEKGRMDCLKWLHVYDFPIPSLVIGFAVRKRHYSIARWMHSIGLMIQEEVWRDVSYSREANEDFLGWLKETEVPWPERIFNQAAMAGNLEFLKWLRKEGCPTGIHVVASAGIGGHLGCVKWLLELGFPPDTSVNCTKNNKECFLYLLSRGIR